MAWPYTARNTTFNVGSQVPSAHLNEVQDKIIPVYRRRVLCTDYYSEFYAPVSGSSWSYNVAGNYWQASADSDDLYVAIPALSNIATLTTVYVKYYIGGSNCGFSFHFDSITDLEIGSGNTAPTTEDSSLFVVTESSATYGDHAVYTLSKEFESGRLRIESIRPSAQDIRIYGIECVCDYNLSDS